MRECPCCGELMDEMNIQPDYTLDSYAFYLSPEMIGYGWNYDRTLNNNDGIINQRVERLGLKSSLMNFGMRNYTTGK